MKNKYADFIRQAAANLGVSHAVLARKAGISAQNISNILAGSNFPSEKNLLRIADALELGPDEKMELLILLNADRSEEPENWQKILEIVHDSELSNKARKSRKNRIKSEIPVFDPLVDFRDGELQGTIVEKLPVGPGEYCSDLFAIRINGNHLAPRFEKGDIAIFRRSEEGNISVSSIPVAFVADGWSRVEPWSVYRDPRGKWILEPGNPAHKVIEIDEALNPRILGTLVEVRFRPES
ncbi:MAG: helix-turn-helix domain-containing protein [Candidatus Riflebacteria bacterium]|nr:helix-turn-helix domain-containing protein [Candidatus Riflebacteria bacterium]